VLTSILALGMFASFGCLVLDGNELTAFDSSLAARLHQHAADHPAVTASFMGITSLGNPAELAVLVIGVALVLAWRRCRGLALVWMLVVAGGGILNELLKDWHQRPRPRFEDPLITPGGWSFPSGHAMGSLICYGMLAYLLILALPRSWKRHAVVGALATLVLAIGFSRIYLGAHFCSDVVGGFAASTVYLTGVISALEWRRKQSDVGSIQEVEAEDDELLAEEDVL